MANPFEHKFRQFSAGLGAETTADKVAETAAQANAVYQDKPFSVEYRPLFAVARIGRALAQVVTFMATAGIGMFALLQIVPAGAPGYYIAAPIALLFAFGVEQVKWRALAIAAKQIFKYHTLGAAGLVAVLGVCVSVFFAIVGAKELPEIVNPVPTRPAADAAQVAALDAGIDRVQADINRLQSSKSWTTQNRTIPRLMRERADLVQRRAGAAKMAQDAAGEAYNEAHVQRAATVQRMRVYCIAAAVAGESIFLLCGVWILYYLFRQFAETAGSISGAETTGARENQTLNGVHGVPAQGVRYTVNLSAADRTTKIVNDTGKDVCEHCGNTYLRNHKKQKFCSEACRVASWEDRTGAKLQKGVH